MAQLQNNGLCPSGTQCCGTTNCCDTDNCEACSGTNCVDICSGCCQSCNGSGGCNTIVISEGQPCVFACQSGCCAPGLSCNGGVCTGDV